MNKLTKAGIAGLFLSLTAVMASCGGSSTSTTDTAAVTADVYPVTVGDLTLDAQPTSIISLSPSATEMLYAIGAGSQVVAVDEYSNFPAEAVALGTKLSGFEPNIEAISSYSPDLVIVSYDPGSLVEQLKTLNIPVFIAGAAMSLENVYEQIEQLGVLTGHIEQTGIRGCFSSNPFQVIGWFRRRLAHGTCKVFNAQRGLGHDYLYLRTINLLVGTYRNSVPGSRALACSAE